MSNEGFLSSTPSGNIDPYALFEALTGKKIDWDALSEGFSRTFTKDYDDLTDFKHDSNIGKEPQPNHPPKDSELNVGAINPYALVEAVLSHKLGSYLGKSMNVARIISDILQTATGSVIWSTLILIAPKAGEVLHIDY
ncbi:MAG: hypothetical protein M1818_003665 [Claussenomyces sp. TS43310]|nr:MAG: hypothetical protein M1818_003665 [Claussenomyces sp. TS43310]